MWLSLSNTLSTSIVMILWFLYCSVYPLICSVHWVNWIICMFSICGLQCFPRQFSLYFVLYSFLVNPQREQQSFHKNVLSPTTFFAGFLWQFFSLFCLILVAKIFFPSDVSNITTVLKMIFSLLCDSHRKCILFVNIQTYAWMHMHMCVYKHKHTHLFFLVSHGLIFSK